MNPYAPHLGNRDAHAVISASASRLRALLVSLGQAGAERSPAPGKWTVREILCHLADTEIAFAFRLRQALAESHHVIQPFDQEKWAAAYAAFDAQAAMEVFAAVRRWNLTLIDTVPPTAFDKPVTHPERGQMTFRTLVETMAGHDLNHLSQVEAIAGQLAARSST